MFTVSLGSISTTSSAVDRHGLVLPAARDDVHLPRPKLDVTCIHSNGQAAAQDEEELVRVWVAVPGELPFVLTTRTS